jgi:catechol 2,3-dioxygenase-like lactoylglutathione lyase family enzyme
MPAVPIRGFAFVTIYTRDLVAAKAFYVERLGFPILRDAEQAFVQIDVAGVPVCIDASTDPIRPNTIAVEVEDLTKTETVLTKLGLKPHSGSNAAAREEWLELQDPDGNLLVFLAPRLRGRE